MIESFLCGMALEVQISTTGRCAKKCSHSRPKTAILTKACEQGHSLSSRSLVFPPLIN